MDIVMKTGNLLDATTGIIMYQVNDAGVMGSGIAAAIAHKWPYVQQQYIVAQQQGHLKLGEIIMACTSEFPDSKCHPLVANLCAQDLYQREHSFLSTGIPTSYDALWMCLNKLARYCKENGFTTVAMPYLMSSCRGGANWNIVITMVQEAFSELEGTIEVWQLPAH